jgi:hypothetical protein
MPVHSDKARSHRKRPHKCLEAEPLIAQYLKGKTNPSHLVHRFVAYVTHSDGAGGGTRGVLMFGMGG